jgi:hypothetical protein
MKNLLYSLAIILGLVGIAYLIIPGGSLPPFAPGYYRDATRIHAVRAAAAFAIALFLFLIGLSND